jgi:hypothetical protein
VLTRLSDGNIEISVRAPLVYLDHWAIREISSSPEYRAHFLETFRTRGTLMFSVMNMLEMARNTGESYARIRDLLDAVDRYWVLSDPDPRTAHERERRGILPPETFHVPVAIFAGIYKNLPEGTLHLGAALESLQDEVFRDRARAMLERPSELRRLLLKARKRYERGEIWQGSSFPTGSPQWISDMLTRCLIEGGKRIEENDVVDLLHAAIPLRYAAIVLLDKAWADFARKLRLADVQIFAKPQLLEALEAIRQVDITHHEILRPQPPRIMGS